MGESKKGSGPGTNPLGHSPFGHEKLEGPKKHHDWHGNDASRPGSDKKPPVPREHWEVQYDGTSPSENMILVQGAAFNPKRSNVRKTTYIKVNEADH